MVFKQAPVYKFLYDKSLCLRRFLCGKKSLFSCFSKMAKLSRVLDIFLLSSFFTSKFSISNSFNHFYVSKAKRLEVEKMSSLPLFLKIIKSKSNDFFEYLFRCSKTQSQFFWENQKIIGWFSDAEEKLLNLWKVKNNQTILNEWRRI